jgi:nucleotide-binding universal stress UspA family protein
MGTHGYKGLERVVYGSVAEAVVASARVPVLTVRKLRDRFALHSLLCPVNMTPYSAVALSYAALMAQAAGASLTALYVRPETVWEEDARLLMANFLRETLGASALSVRTLISKGDPREEIARQAEKGRFDAVILSAHRRPWSSDLILGATAQRVLRATSVPVLSVPATIRKRGKAPEAVWPAPRTKAIF